jgi:hypothetical protein
MFTFVSNVYFWGRGIFVVCKKISVWMDVWKLNPERLGSLWLKASATGGGGGVILAA